MSVTLDSLAPCFQGILPAQLFTCSSDGTPNAAYISHVEYVDASHVALSFQFFNKSRRNIAENPQASVMVIDPDTGQGWLLRLDYVRSETSGPLFERMALRIEAIASYTGLKGIFKLRAADVYRVRAIAPADEEAGLAPHGLRALPSAPVVFTPSAMASLVQQLSRAASVEALYDACLSVLDEQFGFRHSMLLLPTEQEGVLVTVATRGYGVRGVGAEMRQGEGIGGWVAEARKPVRVSGLLRGLLYALAMHRRGSESGIVSQTREIPVPALDNPDSQLGIPLLASGELVGVLCLESECPYRYHEDDKAMVEVLGAIIGLAIQQAQWQARAADGCPDADIDDMAATEPAPPAAAACDGQAHALAYHATDECVLTDDEYLIRGVPARILWRLLRIRQATGREEFTNRELRLDKSLGLPEWKDNLESRLILLRRRLEQKTPWMRLAPRGRGRFALELTAPVALEER